MAYLVIQKTAAQFTADNNVLRPNQIGVETDTLLTKVGSGQVAWNSLYYDTPVKGAFEQTLSALKYRVPSSYAVTQAIAAAGVTPTLAQVLTAGRNADVTGTINDSGGVLAINIAAGAGPGARALYDNSAVISVNWKDRNLNNSAGAVTLNWSSRTLYTGKWDYDLDYSGSYVARSLVDKAYVDGAFFPIAGVVPLSQGGTNANLTASLGGIFYSTATAGAILAGTATAGQMLRSGASAAPTWSTNVWPNTAGSGQALYATSANIIGSSANFTYTNSLNIFSPTGGAATGIVLTQSANNGVAASSYTSIDFNVPTTGLIGQFLSTASNYSSVLNLLANSVALLAEASAGQLALFAAGATGVFTINTGGYGSANERFRIASDGFTTISTSAKVTTNLGVGVVATERLHVQSTTNAQINGLIENTNAGTSGIASWRVKNNSGTIGQFGIYGSGVGAYGAISAGETHFYTNAAGLTFMADNAAGILKFATGGSAEKMRVTSLGNLSLGGTANRATTTGTKALQIFNGIAPVGTLANGVSLYSVAGKLWAMDAGGTATQLTP